MAKKAKISASKNSGPAPTKSIDTKAKQSNDWRFKILADIRKIIQAADPDAVEEVKWRKPTNPVGVPVWSHDGIICTGETYKDKVKLTFMYGASLEDPAGLFNSSLDGNTRRAIDFVEGNKINEKALKALICAAVAFNSKGPAKPAKVKPRRKKVE